MVLQCTEEGKAVKVDEIDLCSVIGGKRKTARIHSKDSKVYWIEIVDPFQEIVGLNSFCFLKIVHALQDREFIGTNEAVLTKRKRQETAKRRS